MSVLVFAESPNGQFKKAAFEAVHYGKLTANSLGGDCIAVVIGPASNPGQLGKYGADKVLHEASQDAGFDSKSYAQILSELANSHNAHTVIVNHSSAGKSLLGRIAVRLDAGSVSQVNSVASRTDEGVSISKPVFSGKAYATFNVEGGKQVFSLMGNAIPPEEIGSDCLVEEVTLELNPSTVKVLESKTVDGVVPLPEAELVVSAGRGMKGPENWGIIEDLASTIGATTACSRPVADTGWRPHHEHVGQTGVAIRPNLYIAAGISGAIQHLAGVNSSKCIVVINKDPEAPFFKAADYGVCADLFDVVPRLTEAFQKFKEQ